MADTFEIEIATPEKLVIQQHAEFAEIPGKDGYLGVLPGHAALLSELGPRTPQTLLSLGTSGVRRLIDVRDSSGWRLLRRELQ